MSRLKIGPNGELGVKEMYDYYHNKHDDGVSKVVYKAYKTITEEYLDLLMKAVLEGETTRLPHYMGRLFIKKAKTNYKRPSPDWGTYRKTGVKAVHTNIHSDGYKVSFHWEKKRVVLKANTKRSYSFTASRDRKRELGAIMQQPNEHTRYLEHIYNETNND